MHGKAIAVAGGVVVAIGVFALIAAHNAGSGVALAWLAIVIGLLTIVGGVVGFMTSFMSSQHSPESDYGATEIRLLIQCMGAVAAADGEIAAQEIGTIARIYQRVLGLSIDEDEVADILSQFNAGFDIAGRLEAEREKLSPQMRQCIVKSCYLVMMSDLVEDQTESGKITEIGMALGYTSQQVDDLVAMAGL